MNLWHYSNSIEVWEKLHKSARGPIKNAYFFLPISTVTSVFQFKYYRMKLLYSSEVNKWIWMNQESPHRKCTTIKCILQFPAFIYQLGCTQLTMGFDTMTSTAYTSNMIVDKTTTTWICDHPSISKLCPARGFVGAVLKIQEMHHQMICWLDSTVKREPGLFPSQPLLSNEKLLRKDTYQEINRFRLSIQDSKFYKRKVS